MSPRSRSLALVWVLVTGILAMAAPPVAGEPILIDFEDFEGMDYFSGQPIPESARLSDQLAADLGVVFSSGAPYVAVVAVGMGHATSGINAVGGSTPEGILTYEREWPVVITFVDPQNPGIPAVTDFVSLRGDLWGSSEMVVALHAYDLDGALVDSDEAFDVGGETLTVTGAGIHRVEFLGTHDWCGVAIDDLTFNPVEAPTAVEPRTWGRVRGAFR